MLGGNDFSLLGFLRIGSCTCTQQTGFRQQRVRSPFNPFLAPAHSVVTDPTHTGRTRTPLQEKKCSQEKVTSFHFVRVQPFLELTCCRSVSFLLGIYCALLCLMPLPMPLATLRHDGAVLLDLEEAAYCETETVREVLLARVRALSVLRVSPASPACAPSRCSAGHCVEYPAWRFSTKTRHAILPLFCSACPPHVHPTSPPLLPHYSRARLPTRFYSFSALFFSL